MTPPRHSRRGAIGDEAPARPAALVRRGPALALVAVGLAVGGLLGGLASAKTPQIARQPLAVAAEAAPESSQSSSWYCPGGTGTANGQATSTLLVVNSGSRRVAGTVRVADGAGKSATGRLSVAGHAEVAEPVARLLAGSWLASEVDLAGGAVTVSDLVSGPSGWAVTPCASETSANWYFATGSTALGNSLYVTLYNPTASLAVVDMSFLASNGLEQPQAYQGIVLPPGRTVTEPIGTYVQDQAAVATEVSARSGAVVASALEVYGAGGISGLSFRLGAPALAPAWNIPRAADEQGGTSQLAVLNPSDVAEKVTVAVQLPSGPVAPFHEEVAPGTVWALPTGQQIRIPLATDYGLRITATGGPGVVVERTDAGPSAAAAPQWGTVGGLADAATLAADRWILPGLPPTVVPGAGAVSLAVQNPGNRAVRVTVGGLTSRGGVTHLRVRAHGIATTAVRGAAVVEASGPVAVVGDGSPAGGSGLVVFPAVPGR